MKSKNTTTYPGTAFSDVLKTRGLHAGERGGHMRERHRFPFKCVFKYAVLFVFVSIICQWGSSPFHNVYAANPPDEDDLKMEDVVDMSLDELLNVKVVSATRKSQKISEAPAIISVITSKQIRQRGYRSIGQALEGVPGLDLLQDQVQYNLGVRGVSGGMRAWSKIVKIMIDNQPVSFRPSTENWLDEALIPIEAVERIEVVRGPGSALYGANAFLGVVNIITKEGKTVKGGEINGHLGNVENHFAYGESVLLGGIRGNVDFLVAGTASYADRSGLAPGNVPGSLIYGSNETSRQDIARPLSLFAKGTIKSSAFGALTLDFNFQRLDTYGEFQDWGALTHRNRISATNYYLRGKYSRTFSKRLSGTVSVAYSQGKPQKKEALAVSADGSDWISRDVGVESIDMAAELTYTIDSDNNFTLGFDYARDQQDLQTHYTHTPGNPPTPNQGIEYGSADFKNTGFYAQMILYPFKLIRAKFMTGLGVTAGLRYDNHNIYDDVFNYRIGGVYPISKKLYTKLLYGTSFKAPAATQLFTNYIIAGGVIGNPDLQPEKASTLELALGVNISSHFNLNLNSFYNVIKDKVELVLPIGDVSNVMADNTAEITSVGIEMELIFNFKNFSGM